MQNMVRKLAKDPLMVIIVVGDRGDCRVPPEVHRLQRQEKSITKKILDFYTLSKKVNAQANGCTVSPSSKKSQQWPM